MKRGKSRQIDEFVQGGPQPGLAGTRQRRSVLRSGHPLLPGSRPATTPLPNLRRARRRNTIQTKVTKQVQTLDPALHDTMPALLALLDALPADSPFCSSMPCSAASTRLPPQGGCRCPGQAQPLLLVCEDLHWLDTVNQALFDSLREPASMARLVLAAQLQGPDYRMAGGARHTTRNCGWTPRPRRVRHLSPILLGDDSSPAPLHPTPDPKHEGNPSSWRRA